MAALTKTTAQPAGLILCVHNDQRQIAFELPHFEYNILVRGAGGEPMLIEIKCQRETLCPLHFFSVDMYHSKVVQRSDFGLLRFVFRNC